MIITDSLRKKYVINGKICPIEFTKRIEGHKFTIFSQFYACCVVFLLTRSLSEVEKFLERQKTCFRDHESSENCWCNPIPHIQLKSGATIYVHQCECKDKPSAEFLAMAIVDAAFEEREEDEVFSSEDSDGLL